jgi:hypothetical protein
MTMPTGEPEDVVSAGEAHCDGPREDAGGLSGDTDAESWMFDGRDS